MNDDLLIARGQCDPQWSAELLGSLSDKLKRFAAAIGHLVDLQVGAGVQNDVGRSGLNDGLKADITLDEFLSEVDGNLPLKIIDAGLGGICVGVGICNEVVDATVRTTKIPR